MEKRVGKPEAVSLARFYYIRMIDLIFSDS